MAHSSVAIKEHQPCEDCGSSDALTEYSDGHTYCFSCNVLHHGVAVDTTPVEVVKRVNVKTYEYLPLRGITKETMKFYDSKTGIDESGKAVTLETPYGNGRTKVRVLPKAGFSIHGEANGETGFLFGRDKFSEGSARAITITEGEIDAMSVYQMFGSQYPVVSVSSSSSAKSDCTKDYGFLNSFEKIYLCFDNDEPGKKATQEVASLFPYEKIYIVKMDRKDANEYLQANEVQKFSRIWWAAKRWSPENIISSYTEIEEALKGDTTSSIASYPFSTLQEQTYGIRTGEVVLIKAPEKVGKTEFIRAIEYHILKETDHNMGVIHLEENKSRLIKGLVGYEMNQPVHLPDSNVSNEEVMRRYKEITKRDERLHVYTHFGTDDPDIILENIRFMAAVSNCRFIFFDHLSQVVSGLEDESERKKLDYISTKLCNMVEDYDFSLFVISHVNDDGKTRGSRYISKVADLIISLQRNVVASEPESRNRTFLTIEGNRFAGRTGPSGELLFDPGTFKLTEDLKLPQ